MQEDRLTGYTTVIMSSPSGSLSAQCEQILAAIKQYEQSGQTNRAQRVGLVQSLNKLALCLKDPREAIFDHFTNVGYLPFSRTLGSLPSRSTLRGSMVGFVSGRPAPSTGICGGPLLAIKRACYHCIVCDH